MRSRALYLVLAFASVAVTACGSVEEGTDTTEGATATSAASGPITITDSRGEEIALDAPAAEVVALEWGVVENLVSLGVMPIGVADVEGYSTWVSAAPLDEGVEDVGMRGEPSTDAINALEPDLIIVTSDLPPEIIDQLDDFYPVVVVRGAAAESPIDQMRNNLTMVAQAVGKEAEAEALLADLDTAIADGASALADAGLEGQEYTMADGWLDGNNVSVRAFTSDSLVGAVADEMGLVNAWEIEGDPDYGLAVTDVEGLTNLGDVEFIYYDNAAYEDPFASLDGNAIWEGLPFVQDGNVHRLPDGIWMFGGPLSVQQFIDATVDALTE